MFKTLHARLRQGYRTGTFPRTEPKLPDRFLGRPVIASDATAEDAAAAAAVCPVGAVLVRNGQPAIDTGRCIFCGKCTEACPRITFSKQHRLAALTREALVVTAGPPAAPPHRRT